MKKGVEWKDSDDEDDSDSDADDDAVEKSTASNSDSDEDEDAAPPAPSDGEDKELAKSMMSKKARRLYGRMQHGLDKRQAEVDELTRKRKELKKRERDSEVEIEKAAEQTLKKPKIQIVYSDDEADNKEDEVKINKRHQCIGGKGKEDGKSAGLRKVERKKDERKKIEKEFEKPVGMVGKKKKGKGRKGKKAAV